MFTLIPGYTHLQRAQPLSLAHHLLAYVEMAQRDRERLLDVRKNRVHSMHEDRPGEYVDKKEIVQEIESSKQIFKKNNWPIIDVTRKSVEETAASVIKIYEISRKNA